MSRDEWIKKLLEEAELPAHEHKNSEKLLAQLCEEPGLMGMSEPPLNYEQELLGALRQKLSQGTQAQPKFEPAKIKSAAKFTDLFRLNLSMRWINSALGMALLLVIVGFGGREYFKSKSGSTRDFVSEIAFKGDDAEIRRWLASVGDSGIRYKVAQNDLQALSMDLSETKYPERILKLAIEKLKHP